MKKNHNLSGFDAPFPANILSAGTPLLIGDRSCRHHGFRRHHESQLFGLPRKCHCWGAKILDHRGEQWKLGRFQCVRRPFRTLFLSAVQCVFWKPDNDHVQHGSDLFKHFLRWNLLSFPGQRYVSDRNRPVDSFGHDL